MSKYLLLFSLFFVSCSPVYYKPQIQNIPIISEKGEIQVGGFLGSDSLVGLQGAYGITNHIAINASYNNFREKEYGDYGGGGKVIDFNIGYFEKFHKYWFYEAYLGYGFGKINVFRISETENVNSNLQKFGGQFSIGFRSEIFMFGYTMKLVNLHYSNIRGNMLDGVAYLNANNNHLLLEPAVTLRLGYEPIYFQAQLGSSINLTNSEFNQDENVAMIGLFVDLKTKKKSKSQPSEK